MYFIDDGETLLLADPETSAEIKRFSIAALQAEHANIVAGEDVDFSAREGVGG